MPAPSTPKSGSEKRSTALVWVATLGGNLILFGLYFFSARWGLTLGPAAGFATFVWPPTGIALAALFTFGFRLWPGVFAGAYLINWMTGAPEFVAVGIAFGNTLEAVCGATLLLRVGFDPSMRRLRDVLGLVFLAALGSTLLSASIGVISLLGGGLVDVTELGRTWLTWWLGDVGGNLIVAPFLMVWMARPFVRDDPMFREPRRLLEAVGMVLLFTGGCFFIFTDFPNWSLGSEPLFARTFLVFPMLTVVAFRLGTLGTATATLIVAAVNVWAISTGHHRYFSGTLYMSLLETQIFLAVLAGSKLTLAAALSERSRHFLDAQRAIQMRDEFLSIASHELRTPLTSLSLQFQLFNRALKAQVASRPLQSQDVVPIPLRTALAVSSGEKQIQRFSSLLEKLFDLTRFQTGKFQLNEEVLDLKTLISEVIQRFQVDAAQKGISIGLRADAPLVGTWDRLRIEQVASNLISNAIKYGEGKPVFVSLSRDPLRRQARITVRDNGLGIPQGQQSRIFERFERGDASAQKIAGLGLGLYICRQIVRAHGGSISVESEPGKGSEFTVVLPVGSGKVVERPDRVS